MTRASQDFSPRTAPLPHQREAIQYVIDTPSAAIFDEQGLGKTKIVIDAFCELMRTGAIDAALVVAPMSLVFNWEAEVRKHSRLIPVVLRGSKREKKYRFMTGANFYLVNYEALASQRDIFRKLVDSRRFAVALDESTRIKTPTTQAAESVFAVTENAVRRVIMTGTPIANRPADLWSQFFFLDRGELLGTDYAAFVARTDPDSETAEDDLRALSVKIMASSIRRLKDDVLELPDKTYIAHSIELAGPQLEMYTRCARDLVVELRALSGDAYIHEIDNVLEKLLRLVQIASNPGLVDPLFPAPVAKLDHLEHLVGDLLTRHEKVIVWSSFVENIECICRRLSEYEPFKIHGGVSAEERASIVPAFQDSARHTVLVANPAAAREGLTLTRASAAVYVDRTFNLVDYLQSQDRIHRIGQDRPCEIHKLVAKHTVDEYVDAVIAAKSSVADFVYCPDGDKMRRMQDLRADRDEVLGILEEVLP
jgi:SWI/SNF-related matrix-associated actin-dependent regulator 1 of chromatin subfamily A